MAPLRLALQTHPNLWNQHRYRTTFHGTPFRGIDDILLRYSRPELHEGVDDPLALVNDTMLVQYPAWGELPEAHEVIFNLMRRCRALMLGRVIIARLPPGGVIQPHADDYGDYAGSANGLRFHICVQGLPGCEFRCGDEAIQAKTDEVWWFDHREVHSAENHSRDDRIHLLVDMQTG
jgi:Aspartyl/Asparaginyl beta-hydroxylase